MGKFIISRFLVLMLTVICAILPSRSPGLAAEKLVGLQSAPSIAMAVPGFAEGSAELKVLEPRLDIKPIAIQAALEEIAKTDPRTKQVKAEQLIDRRFLEEMEKDGTFARLGLAR